VFEPAVAAAAFLVLAACVLPLRPGVLTRALEWRPLAVLGIASYSLYLWHVPLITTVADNPVTFGPAGGRFTGQPHQLLYLAVAALPVCIAVALASYAIIESPFLRLRRQWAVRTGTRGGVVPDATASGQPLEAAPSPKRT
jgi:peptidoglycan/LPS O-acetylase OafA/YrhL